MLTKLCIIKTGGALNSFLLFIVFSLFFFTNAFSEDKPVGYIASVVAHHNCEQTIEIKVYTNEYADGDTWANFDVSVNNTVIATIKGDDTNGDWNFTTYDPEASVKRVDDGLYRVTWD